MPIRRFTFDEVVRSSSRRVVELWRPIAGWTLLVWLTLALILVPTSTALVGRFLLRSESPVVGNEDLLTWVLMPLGFAYLLLMGSLGIVDAVVRYAGIFCIVTDKMEGRPPSVRRTALELAPRLLELFRLCVKMLLAAAVLASPLAVALAAIYALLLRSHDINYYLAAQPAEWRLALALGAAATLLWAVPVLHLCVRSVLALPASLDGYRPAREALRRSWGRTRGGARRLATLLASVALPWLLFRFAVQALLLPAAGATVELVGTISRSVYPILMTTALVGMGLVAVDAVISFFGFALVSTVVTKFYLEGTRLHQSAPTPPSLVEIHGRADAVLRRWLRPRRALPVAALLLGLSALAGALLLDVSPRDPRRVAVHAHRAGPGPSPENTLAALSRSIAAGADYAEIDVQRTRDGVVVLLHDADFMRVAGDPRRIVDVPHREVAAMIARPNDGTPAAERKIPTLPEFLERARGRIGLNIELKYYRPDPGLAPAVVRDVLSHDMAGDVVITSLRLAALRQVRSLEPRIPIGYVSAVAVGDLLQLPVDFLSIARRRASRPQIRAAHSRGLEVHAWTVNRADVMAALIDAGVDGIITDDPELAVRVREELAALPPPARMLLRFRDSR